jgi:acetyl-CoA carboxylase biotin carboxyl carrier protein
MKIDSDAIRELADLLNETGLTEIEVSEGEQAIRVSKGAAVFSGAAQNVMMASDPAIPGQASVQDSPPQLGAHPGAVKSPMVGTAYMQSEPGSPPFAKKGDQISIGDTILIIEAMKVMNPIKAEKSGTVMQVLVDNGEPVEYGDVLMIIE